jgi:diguanylate cyclase (GGDEF)-like protein
VEEIIAEGEVIGRMLGPADRPRATLRSCLRLALPLAGRALRNAMEHRKIVSLALTDQLTGVATRRLFFELLRREHERYLRDRRAYAVVIVDLDRFKAINDQHGHAAGDRVLAELARAFLAKLRKVDVLARIGGDEFAVLLPGVDARRARWIGERLCKAAHEVQTPEGEPMTVSVGVASTTSVRIRSPQELVETADAALYRAKRAGRNSVTGPEDAQEVA